MSDGHTETCVSLAKMKNKQNVLKAEPFKFNKGNTFSWASAKFHPHSLLLCVGCVIMVLSWYFDKLFCLVEIMYATTLIAIPIVL